MPGVKSWYCFQYAPSGRRFPLNSVTTGVQICLLIGTFVACVCVFLFTCLEKVSFWTCMIVSYGMLTFALPGVPKSLWTMCQKTTPYFATEMLSHAPKGLQREVRNRTNTDALAYSGPRRSPRPIVDRCLLNWGCILVPSSIDVCRYFGS